MEYYCKKLNNLIKNYLLTFLKTSRVQMILPKHANETGRCAIAMIAGSIRCVSFGNKYQSNCSIVKRISSNALFIR